MNIHSSAKLDQLGEIASKLVAKPAVPKLEQYDVVVIGSRVSTVVALVGVVSLATSTAHVVSVVFDAAAIDTILLVLEAVTVPAGGHGDGVTAEVVLGCGSRLARRNCKQGEEWL
jgi:hypothetical protein